MNNNIKLILVLSICLISFASASEHTFGTFEQDDCVNVSQPCASCSYVNISSIGNNQNSNLITNVEMINFGNGEWRYEFCNTSELGRYDVKGKGDINGVDTSFATYFLITPNGEEPNVARGIMFLSAIIVLILFLILSIIAFIKTENYIAKFTLYWVSHIFSIALTFTLWNMAENFLASYPFIIGFFRISWWFIFIAVFPMFILSMVWIFYIHTMNDHIKALIEKGEDPATAFAIAKKKKKRGGY